MTGYSEVSMRWETLQKQSAFGLQQRRRIKGQLETRTVRFVSIDYGKCHLVDVFHDNKENFLEAVYMQHVSQVWIRGKAAAPSIVGICVAISILVGSVGYASAP